MTSTRYAAIRVAVEKRQQMTFVFRGRPRLACPHTLGWTEGTERVLVYQFGGQSSKGLQAGGDWRCMDIAEISGLIVSDGTWHTGSGHSRPQTCIKLVDIEVR